jgi:hypothetical protein
MEITAKLDTIYQPSEDVVYREIDGESIIVPLTAGIGDMEDALFSLNETGKVIWKKLDGARSLKTVIGELAREFEATQSELEPDVLGFVEELLSRGMLVEENEK